MTPQQRWQAVQDLFEAALEQEAADRTAFVEVACGDDAALCREVLSLLAAFDESDDIEAQAQAWLASVGEPLVLPSLEGRRIGAYRVLHELGAGGMGAVYLAERADGQFEQRVALKLLRQGIGTDELWRRFLYERQILARLQHPHVARLYDGGLTDEGRPYFVMEYVEGLPLNRYCDDRRLDVAARLDLFIAVCRAVSYAHQNLVVHRDLKPSNILVTDDGAVKLLDFGIAKLLEDEAEAPVTETGLRVMTPEYAAPEQVRGEAVTTATDVYALGVVLYELLTGRRPYEVKGLAPGEVERVVCETAVARPSTAIGRGRTEASAGAASPEAVSRARSTQPARLRQRLAGDLDTITLKALKKEPARRYVSAEVLLEDVRRHLAGLPVAARDDTLGYRMRTFVRRHRVGVAVAAAFVALLLVAAVAMMVQQRATARERDRARLEADKNAQTSAFLADIFTASNPYEETQGEPTARALLARGVERIGTLVDQPEVQAAMRHIIGTVYYSRGDYEQARVLLEQALSARQALHGPDHPEVARTLVALGRAFWHAGQHDSAAVFAEQAVTVFRGLSEEASPDLVDAVLSLGTIRRVQGRYDEAETLLREALAMHEGLPARDSLQLATLMNNLATTLANQGQFDESETLYRAALEVSIARYGDDHPQVAMQMHTLASFLHTTGKLDEAASLQRQALAMETRFLGEEHPNVLTTQNQLGIVLTQMGALEEAEQVLRRTLALRRQVLGPDHLDVAATMNNLGRVLGRQGKYEEAEPFTRQALGIARQAFGEEHFYTGIAWSNLGQLLIGLGRDRAAEDALRRALAIFETALPEGHTDTAEMRSQLGDFLFTKQRYDEAEPLLVAAHEVFRAERGDADASTQRTVQRLVALYEAWSKPAEAARYRALLADAKATRPETAP